ncbi:hypothetical protein QWJ34_26390 [Saccharibacillus sp. CPCC 101409]|uniref:hypothetical protein n=1 Tax=Saccharibacillus sp. CPCC 101409 TaxID=3058041 RepID=UPI0026710896|nr:hypothetical protein [Saccharibacillus sp. CPCC 101409]MDO3413309.1 hypothetical protein [Saccharibacillus sp. CPCC 101409]
MSLFLYEFKKIWNWRILALIAALAALVWFSILRGDIQTYKTVSHYGLSYGPYQREMFEKYGPTLEPEELADYDIPGKQAALYAELDDWIAQDPLFTGNGISTYAEYDLFRSKDRSGMSEAELEPFDEITMQMDMKLSLDEYWNDPRKQFASPYVRLGMISNLYDKYAEYEPYLQDYIDHDERPVVAEAARRILARHNNSLVPDNLNGSVSLYATVVGVSVILAALLLVSPPLARDRMRRIYLLHYSSAAGRRMLFIQWAAMAFSACALSLLLVGLSAIPLFAAGVGDYLGASMLVLESGGGLGILYDITFGQYAMLLAGMIVLLSVGAACFAFLLAKFSTNTMSALVKIVPLGLAFWVLYLSAISDSFFEHNALFSVILRGRAVMPELILCMMIAAAGAAAAVIVTARENKVDAA